LPFPSADPRASICAPKSSPGLHPWCGNRTLVPDLVDRDINRMMLRDTMIARVAVVGSPHHSWCTRSRSVARLVDILRQTRLSSIRHEAGQ
jgi:hypothetical protein